MLAAPSGGSGAQQTLLDPHGGPNAIAGDLNDKKTIFGLAIVDTVPLHRFPWRRKRFDTCSRVTVEIKDDIVVFGGLVNGVPIFTAPPVGIKTAMGH